VLELWLSLIDSFLSFVMAGQKRRAFGHHSGLLAKDTGPAGGLS